MAYIPKSIGELYDRIVSMTMMGPEFSMPEFPDMNIDKIFQELFESLDHLKTKLGEVGYKKLQEAGVRTLNFYEEGDDERATLLLQHMSEYLRLKKYKTDEPVVDVSRFQNMPDII